MALPLLFFTVKINILDHTELPQFQQQSEMLDLSVSPLEKQGKQGACNCKPLTYVI